MPAATQPVTIKLADFGGPAVPGVTVTARLSQVDYTVDGTFVSTEPVTGVTDVNGQVVLQLFPCALSPTGLGTVGAVVRVSAPIPSSQPLDVLAVVPNAPCNLVSILVVEQPTGLSQIQQAVRAAIDNRLYPNTYAVAPTTRPDGSPRQPGDRYLDLSYVEYRWNGAAWVNIEANAAASAATATAQAGIATTQAGLAAVAKTAAETARDAALAAAKIFPSTAAALSNGVLSYAALVAGAGGTNGTFDVAFTGGGGSGAAARFVVAGGALTSITITAPGNGYTSAPAMSFAASAGLAGASATAVIGVNAPAGTYFYVPAAASTQSLLLYLNSAGAAVLQKSMITELGAAVFDKASAKEAVGITNIFDKSLATDNFGLPDGGGAPVGSGGLFYTGYLPVIAGDYITFSLAARINFGVQFYDADKNWLSSPGAPAAGTPVAVPATAVYARCTFQNGLSGGRVTNSKHDLVAVQGQTLPSYYMPYGRPSAYTLWRQMAIEAYEGPQRNIFISSTVTLNQTFAYNTGVLSGSAGFFTSDLIPVVPGATYTVYSSVGSNPLNEGALFYDIDQNYIYGQDPAFLTGLTTITVPAGCFFLRIAGRMASNVYNFVQVYRGTAAPGSIGLITPAMKADVAGQWASKNWFVQGDSITDVGVGGFGGWFESAAAFHGAVVSQNAALGGRAMVDALKKHDGTSLAAGDFTSIDMAVLFLGTNDYRTGTPIGSITDSTATASFYGRAKNFVETVLGWKPLIRLVIATPMRMTIDSPNNDPINYVTALRAVAAKYALPVLDFYALSGFNDITMATLTSDGLHPNAAGRVAGVTNPAIGFFKTCLPVT